MYSFVLHYVESVIQQFSCKCLAMTDKQLIRSCGRQNVPLVTKLKSTKGLHLLHNFSETTNTVISLTDSRNPSYLCVMPLFMRSLRQCPRARINHCASSTSSALNWSSLPVFMFLNIMLLLCSFSLPGFYRHSNAQLVGRFNSTELS